MWKIGFILPHLHKIQFILFHFCSSQSICYTIDVLYTTMLCTNGVALCCTRPNRVSIIFSSSFYHSFCCRLQGAGCSFQAFVYLSWMLCLRTPALLLFFAAVLENDFFLLFICLPFYSFISKFIMFRKQCDLRICLLCLFTFSFGCVFFLFEPTIQTDDTTHWLSNYMKYNLTVYSRHNLWKKVIKTKGNKQMENE